MISCPTCGHTGQPVEHGRTHFRVGVCPSCGTGLAISFNGQSTPQAAIPSAAPTTDTGAYELTPTGPHPVVGRGLPSESRVRAASTKQQRKVLIICGAEALRQSLIDVAENAERSADLLSVSDSAEGIEVFCKLVKEEHKPKLVLIDHGAGPIPSQDVAQIIRLVEAGVDANRTPILVLGRAEDSQTVKAVLGPLGNARFVNRGSEGGLDDQARRVLMLVDKILKRSK